MRRWSPERLACGTLLGLVLLGTPPCGRAAEGERVRFETVDQVEIHGTYFASPKGKKGPCALLLHAIGGNSQQEGWEDLAKKLQEKGFAVLTFDFRGHGDSTTINPMVFWNYPSNRGIRGFRPGKPKDQISIKDFTNAYQFLSLVDDIAAAKRFLDKRNDSEECNSSNVAVIGAETGATLGALWIYSEWQRNHMVQGFPLVQGAPQKEGKNISCAVYLTISPTIGLGGMKMTVPVESWLRAREVKEKVPMYFLFGDQDKRARSYAERNVNALLANNKKMTLTGWHEIKGTKLAGRELLGKASLDTDKLIVTYVTKVTEQLGVHPWTKQDVDKAYFVQVPVARYLR
jgi:hypothetical protein